MFEMLALLPLVLVLVFLFLVRRATVAALSSVKTRDRKTLVKVRRALWVLGASTDSAELIMSKDRSSDVGEGASRRGNSHSVAKVLEQRRKRDEKLDEIRKNLAEKFKFKKSM